MIRILHLEDDDADAELVAAQLVRAGLECDVHHVQTREALEDALCHRDWDLVLADYRLPAYDGLSALKLVQATRPELPFIFVSGTMGEDAAIECLTRGATDYVLKDRISRLGPAVERALREAENRCARHRAEVELHKLSRAVEQCAETIIVTDPLGYIEYANPSLTRTTGYTLAEVKGQHTRLFKSDQTPRETYVALWSTITAGRQWRGEIVNRRKNGELFREVLSISPIRGESGEIAHFLAVKEDVTDLRRAEEERAKLERQLLHAQRLESLGMLAGGVAHDFNNIICIIVGHLELLRMQMATDDPRLSALAAMSQAAESATGLCRALLTFGRRHVTEMRPCSINALIDGMRGILQPLLGKSVQLRIELCEGNPVVIADYGQLEQVLMNLATNARDAMPRGGTLTIKTCLDGANDAGDGITGPAVRISVADTGVGMSPEVVSHMFEPFFTTKAPDRGTGLGLSIVYGVVNQHQGTIKCISAPGAGTMFEVLLPLSARHEGEPDGRDRLAAR